MMSSLVNRNVLGAGKRTSMRLEPEAWDAFREICVREDISSEELVGRAVLSRPDGSRTSAVRVFILMYYRAIRTDADDAANATAQEIETNTVQDIDASQRGV
jgi:predicted DNA-binding ribbon-helix-helix protein